MVRLSHPTHRIVGWDKRKIRIGVDQASCHSQATVGTCKSRVPAHQNPRTHGEERCIPTPALAHGMRSFFNVTRILVGRRATCTLGMATY